MIHEEAIFRSNRRKTRQRMNISESNNLMTHKILRTFPNAAFQKLESGLLKNEFFFLDGEIRFKKTKTPSLYFRKVRFNEGPLKKPLVLAVTFLNLENPRSLSAYQDLEKNKKMPLGHVIENIWGIKSVKNVLLKGVDLRGFSEKFFHKELKRKKFKKIVRVLRVKGLSFLIIEYLSQKTTKAFGLIQQTTSN